MNDVAFYVLFDRVHIQAANAVSSPITYGFPALSGFLGAVHALSRKLPKEHDMQLDGVLIACHECEVKRYRPASYSDYSLNQTRNPIKKTGQTASIIEEGKADINVSLLIELRCDMDSYDWLSENQAEFEQSLYQWFFQQRITGGSVQAIGKVQLLDANMDDIQIKASLLPAFVLMDASQELITIHQDLQQYKPEATALDALLDVVTLHQVPTTNNDSQIEWQSQSAKTGRGWLVPMPIGFQGIAPKFAAGELKNCRTNEYPSQYVECLYGLGKWVFPHSIDDISSGFWRYSNDEDGMYLINQQTQTL